LALQDTIKGKLHGLRWWEQKQRKYMEVKHALRYTKENIDTMQVQTKTTDSR
jgi:hypothetical protein